MREPDSKHSKKYVAIWIYTGVFMLLVQVVLGGITRLTGSGLSITEWNVVTGTLPPLNEAAWMAEFEKYRQTPQFQLLNFDFTLSDFKFIFFWEWFHRFWARLIGIVFVAGFVYLVSRRHLKKEMQKPLLVLFLLGALQGAIGWIMVKSGLTGDAIYVKPARLALHFIFALGLISYAFWFALQLSVPEELRIRKLRTRNTILFLITLLVLQLGFGALMAGYKAATAAPTWPDINGKWIPEGLFTGSSFLGGIFENTISIHFIHRILAYILVIFILLFSFQKGFLTGPRSLKLVKILPAIAVVVQVLLGISAVLFSPKIIPNSWGPFEWAAQWHQAVGMLLLLSLVALLYLHKGKFKPISS